MIQAIHARVDGDAVVIISSGHGTRVHYRDILELWRWDKEHIPVPFKTANLEVLRAKDGVTMLLAAKHAVDCPLGVWTAVIKNLYVLAKQLEALRNLQTTIEDQAILLTQSVGILLSPDDRVLAEAAKLLPGAGNLPPQLIGCPSIVSEEFIRATN